MGGVVEYLGRFHHLDHECRAPGVQLVVGANTSEDAIHQTNPGRRRRHVAADLGHQGDQRHLPQIGRFTAHVRPGDDLDKRAVGEISVVGHKPFATRHPRHQTVAQRSLNDRVTAILDMEFGAVRQLRTDVVVEGGNLGQRCGHIQFGQGRSRH